MKTGNLVKVIGARGLQNTVGYNLQDYKTHGRWPRQPWKTYQQHDLVTFHGSFARPGTTLQQQAQEFVYQDYNDESFYHYYHHTHAHRNYTACHTIVQSFDYKTNPDLTPTEVHYLGNVYADKLKTYFGKLGYHLDGALVSTHLDQWGKVVAPINVDYLNLHHMHYRGDQHKEAHLHNHILIPNYNAEGQSIAPFLKRSNIYDMQHIDDVITAHQSWYVHIPKNADRSLIYKNVDNTGHLVVHPDMRKPGIHKEQFKDYYFDKLNREIEPLSMRTIHPKKKAKEYPRRKSERIKWNNRANHRSILQQMQLRFVRADNKAWDDPRVDNSDYQQLIRYRDKVLGIQTKRVQVPHTNQYQLKARVPLTYGYSDYYNISNFGVLGWRNARDVRAERMIRQLDFHSPVHHTKTVLHKPLTYHEYDTILGMSIYSIPKIEYINTPKKRAKYRVNLPQMRHDYQLWAKMTRNSRQNQKNDIIESKELKHALMKKDLKYHTEAVDNIKQPYGRYDAYFKGTSSRPHEAYGFSKVNLLSQDMNMNENNVNKTRKSPTMTLDAHKSIQQQWKQYQQTHQQRQVQVNANRPAQKPVRQHHVHRSGPKVHLS